MAGSDDENPPPPPPQQTPTQQALHTVSTIKLLILKKGEYDTWAMKIEHYLSHTDYPIWEVIQKGNGPVRTTLLMALPEDHLAKFYKMTDAKEMWDAIKSRFGGNDESKKMQKYILKQQFEGFSVSNSEGLHKGYDRYQSLLSQLEIHGAGVSTKDSNQKFLRSLPSSWSQVSLVMRTKPGVDSLSFDDLYNNLGVFESHVKGSTVSSSSAQNVAFVSSESTSSTNDVSTAYGISTSSGYNSQRENSSSYTNEIMYSFFANQSSGPHLDHEDLEQLDEFDLEEMDLKWQVAMISIRLKKFYKKTGRRLQFDAKEPVGFDKTKVECYNCHNTGHFPRECKSKGNQDSRRRDAGNTGYKEKDNERRPKNKRNLKLWLRHRDDKTDVLTYHKKLLAEAVKEKEELKTKLENFQSSSKGLSKLLNSQMSTRDKSGLGMSQTVMMNVVQPSKEQEKPSFAFVNTVKHVKTPREAVKEQNTYSLSPKANKRDWNGLISKRLGLGYGFTKKACFVCGSFSHLIRDCDFHEKRMAKQVELNKKKGKGTGQGETRSVWNNVQRLNHQNNQAATTSTARKVNTDRPIVNEIRPRNNFYKSHLPIRRPFNRTAAPKAKFSNQKVNTAEIKAVSAVSGKRDNPQRALKNKGIIDSECSRYMTGNKAYLAEYQDYNGGLVAFGASKGYITGKERKATQGLLFSWVLFLRTKDETSGILKDFIRQIENQLNQKVKTIICDNGTKFKNSDIIEFCGSKRIKREYSNARTPQQNEVTERKNKTLIEAARTMLAYSFLPNTFWAEAVSTDCYVLNRVLVIKSQNKTPYELITGKIPIISYVRPFGFHVTIFNTIDHLGKFEGKYDEGFLVGYSLNSKAFRVYNLETKRVEENMYINFLENKPNVVGKGPNWLFDLDYLIDSMNYQHVRSENQANKTTGLEEANHSAGTQDNVNAGNSEMEADPAQDYFVLTIYSSYTLTDKSSEAKNEGVKHTKDIGLKINEEPVDQEDQAFLEELKRLKRQEKEANDAAEVLRKEFAQSTEDLLLQAGAARATSTNTVNTVSTPLSTANPSNVFSTGGPSYPNLTNYADQDDSQIPALEDIYGNSNDGIFTNASYDDEGAVADFTNLESTVNVSPIPTSRIHSIHPTTQILGDPKSAVQTRSKVNKSSGAHAFISYIQKQRRNNHKDFQHCLFACFLSQIEPKKISEALEDESWVDAMQEELLQFKIQKVWILVDLPYGKKAIGTKWVYRNKQDERGVVVRNKARLVAQGHRQEEGIDYDEVFAPLPKDLRPSDLFGPLILIWGFIDISNGCESAFLYGTIDKNVTPKTSHSHFCIEDLRYLKGKPKLGLWYPRVSSFDLEAYFDSDYAGANLDRKSTTGGCQFLGRRLISWQCKKQTIVATSTTEAEYVAGANCHVTPLFPNMLAQAVVDEGEGLVQPTEPQPTPSPTQPSTGDLPPVTESSYRHDTTQDPRVNFRGIGGSQGGQFLIYKAKDAQAAEILKLKSRIKKLEKKCKPSISHHRAWLRSVSRLSRTKKLGKKEFVSKQGRKNAKPKPTLDAFDDLDDYLAHGMDYMETEEAVNEGRQSNETEEINFWIEDTKELLNTRLVEKKEVAQFDTPRLEVSNAILLLSLSTPPQTTSIFDDEDITMAQTLIKMKEEKAKEKGVAFKDVEDSSRLVRSITTLKPLLSIDPKDKGKGILVEEEPVKIKRKDQGIDQIGRDEELAHKLHEEELAEIARIQEEKAAQEEASKEEREEYIIEERAKFFAETIAAQRKFKAAQRAAEIRSRPPTKSQLRNLMMTYLKNMGGYKHSQLKAKTFEEIQAM
ncbi:ribonuclease H-like domain-containing protein [Tanacetum coccineum]